MKKSLYMWITIIILIFLANIALADKGQVWPYPVKLAEESQKAIIMHNQTEEILILGIELKGDREKGVLEFIPFPAQPTVSLAKGNPFEALQELISRKQLQFETITKGGSAISPVELKLNAKIGVHDVTVIKINNLAGFKKWVTGFFRKKKIPVKQNLNSVYQNASDYIERGFYYFVFDYVLLKKETRSVEPLVYRFHSEKLYYPLKDSNIIGGEGTVDLALVLPGSLGLLEGYSDVKQINELFNGVGTWDLSSSSKVYADELKAIYPEVEEFFKAGKIYLQTLRFSGRYNFPDDLHLDISNIAPYAYKHIIYIPVSWGGEYRLAELYSLDEKKDLAEAYSLHRPEWVFEPEMLKAIHDLSSLGEGDGL